MIMMPIAWGRIEQEDPDLLPLLQRVARRRPERPVEAGEAAEAVGAAECVAAAAGRPPKEQPEPLVRWLIRHPGGPSVDLMAAAIEAVGRLKEDRVFADDALDDLLARLHGR